MAGPLLALFIASTAGGYTAGYHYGYDQGEEVGYDTGASAGLYKVSLDLEAEGLGCVRSGAPDCSNYSILREWLKGYIETHANSSDWVRL